MQVALWYNFREDYWVSSGTELGRGFRHAAEGLHPQAGLRRVPRLRHRRDPVVRSDAGSKPCSGSQPRGPFKPADRDDESRRHPPPQEEGKEEGSREQQAPKETGRLGDARPVHLGANGEAVLRHPRRWLASLEYRDHVVGDRAGHPVARWDRGRADVRQEDARGASSSRGETSGSFS